MRPTVEQDYRGAATMALTELNPRADRPPVPAPDARPRHVVLLVLGVLLAGAGLVFAGAAATLGAAVLQQGRQGYLESPSERYAVPTYAITSQQLDVVLDDGLPGAGRTGTLASFSLRATPATLGQEIFIGIAPQADVDRYLSQVSHSELSQVRFNPFHVDYADVPGTAAPALPAAQDFWVASAEGSSTQQITSDLRSGSWAVVIMNADGSPAVAVDLQAGVRSSLLAPVSWGSLVLGVALLVGATFLVVAGASGLGRSSVRPIGVSSEGLEPTPSDPGLSSVGPGAGLVKPAGPYPAHLRGVMDPHLSRWLWLVKWLLAVPHYLVLAVLWVALVLTTVVAGFAILFTGRYPRSLFDFNVGVLRWSWRVGFYAYSALGTDRYPPFTLASTDYPADFDVDYPAHLTNGLVLVKSWLLALPHLIILAVFTGNLSAWWSTREDWASGSPSTSGISLLGLLVVIGGFFLLVTRSFPRSLFDFVLGINRWIYRVVTYVALMRDEYPPFHLDQGELEPGGTTPLSPTAGAATAPHAD
jgi:hypothetical protein